MAETPSFPDFIRRVRAGDEQAAAELVRRYGPVIRAEARQRLADPTLHRLVDASDVCQSVLASFFDRATHGQYTLEKPADLLRLLVQMTHNKAADVARRQQARPADRQRAVDQERATLHLSTPLPPPDKLAALRDLLTRTLERLSPEERLLADFRAQGLSWGEIAESLGGTAEGRRKQLARALARVAADLGIEGLEDE